MLATNPIPETGDYRCTGMAYAECGIRCTPTREQAEAGLVPLNTIYSQQWDALWHDTNTALHCLRDAACAVIEEINSVLNAACIIPDDTCPTTQLHEALYCLKTAVGTADKAGSVLSSLTPGEVSIDTNGIMTANCVGNANDLAYGGPTLVESLEAVKLRQDTAFGNAWDYHDNLATGKANNNHACCNTDYGVGTSSAYGHLLIEDEYMSDCGNSAMAASQAAVKAIYDIVNSRVCIGNVIACPLGTASAGSCTTGARSDHVHCFCFVDCADCAQPFAVQKLACNIDIWNCGLIQSDCCPSATLGLTAPWCINCLFTRCYGGSSCFRYVCTCTPTFVFPKCMNQFCSGIGIVRYCAYMCYCVYCCWSEQGRICRCCYVATPYSQEIEALVIIRCDLPALYSAYKCDQIGFCYSCNNACIRLYCAQGCIYPICFVPIGASVVGSYKTLW